MSWYWDWNIVAVFEAMEISCYLRISLFANYEDRFWNGEIRITGNTSAAGIMFYSPSPRPPRSWGHEGRCKSARHVPHNNNRFWRRRNTTILHSYKNHVGWNMILQWKESDRTEVTKKVARVRMLLMKQRWWYRDTSVGINNIKLMN